MVASAFIGEHVVFTGLGIMVQVPAQIGKMGFK